MFRKNWISKSILIFALLISLGTNAQTYRYQDWEAEKIVDQMWVAKTTNDSESTLGVMCVTERGCFPYAALSLTCEENEKYPAMVSTDSGITHIYTECLIIGDRYIMELPSEHMKYFIEHNRYGLAWGSDNGKFKASYFSLKGSTKAIMKARSSASAHKKSNGYRDTYL